MPYYYIIIIIYFVFKVQVHTIYSDIMTVNDAAIGIEVVNILVFLFVADEGN